MLGKQTNVQNAGLDLEGVLNLGCSLRQFSACAITPCTVVCLCTSSWECRESRALALHWQIEGLGAALPKPVQEEEAMGVIFRCNVPRMSSAGSNKSALTQLVAVGGCIQWLSYR